MEVSSSYVKADRGELSGEVSLRSRGLSAVVGVRIGSEDRIGGIIGLSSLLGTTIIVLS